MRQSILVIYAFENKLGDLFVQKSPASTVKDVLFSIKEILKSESKIKIIGTRHGVKNFIIWPLS